MEESFNRMADSEEFQENEVEVQQRSVNFHQKDEEFNNQEQSIEVEQRYFHPTTYIELVVEKDESGSPLSVLEVDLVVSRDKGKEKRRLAINFAGIDLIKKEMIEKSVSIDRENFERLKKYFSELDWNS